MPRTNTERVILWGSRLVEDVDLYLEACQDYGGDLSPEDRAAAAWVWDHLQQRAKEGRRVLAAQDG